jgi:hypothetical protein
MRTVLMRMRALMVIAVLSLALGACGGDDESAPGSPGGGELAGPLEFLVTGGDAFREDRITVRPDGSATVKTRKGTRTADLTEDELAEIEAQVHTAELDRIPEDSTTKPPMPDALGYGFVYEGREVDTDAGSMPDQLKPLVGTFIKLVDRYGAE